MVYFLSPCPLHAVMWSDFYQKYCYQFCCSVVFCLTFSKKSRFSLVVLQIKMVKIEAVVQRCSVKEVLLEISSNSQENTCVPTLFRRCFNVGVWRWINVLQRWKTDVRFCFIFNVESTLFQRWFTTLKQLWTNVEMLAGSHR